MKVWNDVIPVIVALNAYLHDFSVSLAFASSLLANWLGAEMSPRVREKLRRLIFYSFACIIIFGAVRVYFYREYENPAGAIETHVVLMLVIKHVILAGLLFASVLMAWRFLRREG